MERIILHTTRINNKRYGKLGDGNMKIDERCWSNYLILLQYRLKVKMKELIGKRMYKVKKEDFGKIIQILNEFMIEINKDYIRVDFLSEIDFDLARKTQRLPDIGILFTDKITRDSLFAEEVRKYI